MPCANAGGSGGRAALTNDRQLRRDRVKIVCAQLPPARAGNSGHHGVLLVVCSMDFTPQRKAITAIYDAANCWSIPVSSG
jgi:hypothetical protein